jgi:hypothetical protein
VLPTDSAGVEPRLVRGPTEVPTWFTTSPFAGASTFVELIPTALAKTTRFAVLMVPGPRSTRVSLKIPPVVLASNGIWQFYV